MGRRRLRDEPVTGLLHRGMEALTAPTRWDEPPYGILNYGTEALAG